MHELKSWLAESLQTLPDNLQNAKADIKQHFEESLEQKLQEINVLTRDEFMLQVKILQQIEQRLSELETKVKAD